MNKEIYCLSVFLNFVRNGNPVVRLAIFNGLTNIVRTENELLENKKEFSLVKLKGILTSCGLNNEMRG